MYQVTYTVDLVVYAEIDGGCSESAPELISQRRRWLNGSFAASVVSNFIAI
jgi:cellulose synthase/poly-beta-1,6-N-acetylglucosamine synthase-like glycosyltransferase